MIRKLLNPLFILEVVFFFLVILGIIPRATVPYFVIIISIYLVLTPIEDGVVFFVRSIPLFLAIPIISSFDNFNAWRVFSIILFLKLLTPKITNYKLQIITASRDLAKRDNQFSISKFSKYSILLLLLLVIAFLSVLVAVDKIMAIKRIIYFVNLSLIGIVIYNANVSVRRIIKNITIPVIIVTLVGLIQVASTYFIDIYQFMRLWGEGIQCVQFGNQWCTIAVEVGNTWFAYFGDQLSLRAFSLFPDSHSFPVFLLLGIPAILAVALEKQWPKSANLETGFKKLITTRSSFFIVWLALIFLVALLSGTRGIWAASVGVIPLGIILVYIMRHHEVDISKIRFLGYITSFTILFFLLFSVAYPIFVSPQFLVSKGNNLLLQKRIRSILDFGETSNAQRILIWKASLESIKKHPLLGVGIGNFPVVLGQDIKLSKAGSSAHNLYLHVAAEMGILALVLMFWFLWLVYKKIYQKFTYRPDLATRSGLDELSVVYFGALLLYIPWVLAYLMTDPIIFDERVFLLFAITCALILKKGPAIAG